MLNPKIRLAAVMNPCQWILRVTGYEMTNADLPRPVTEVSLAVPGNTDEPADLVYENGNDRCVQ